MLVKKAIRIVIHYIEAVAGCHLRLFISLLVGGHHWEGGHDSVVVLHSRIDVKRLG